MKSEKRSTGIRTAALLVLLAASAATWGIAQVMTPATQRTAAPSAVDPAIALWNKGEYSAAIAEFQKIIQTKDEFALHRQFVNTAAAAQSKEARLKYERDRALAAEKAPKKEAPEKKAEGAAPAYVPPPVLTAEELAKMESDVKAANAALAQLTELYQTWAKADPGKAIYPFELAMLTNRQEFEKREQYLLKAVAIDSKFTEAYQQLFSLTSGIDDVAAARYAKKASELKPDDFQLKLTYASALWTVDPGAARKYYRELVAQNSGTQNGSRTLQQFASATEDPKEKLALIEQFRREYPKDWTPGHYFNTTMYEQSMLADPGKGLALAREVLKQLESASPAPNDKSAQASAERNKQTWKANADYAETLIQARTLIAGKKGADALALLEKAKVPGVLEDSSQLVLLKAEAADAAGGASKAYDLLAAEMVKDISEDYQKAIVKYGARLGKKPQQVDEELWSRRLQRAETFQEFELPKLGGQDRVKLSDYRGKVVMVDFWFPG